MLGYYKGCRFCSADSSVQLECWGFQLAASYMYFQSFPFGDLQDLAVIIHTPCIFLLQLEQSSQGFMVDNRPSATRARLWLSTISPMATVLQYYILPDLSDQWHSTRISLLLSTINTAISIIYKKQKIFSEKLKGFRDGLSYSTPQKSEETGGNVITQPQSHPLKKCKIQGFLFLYRTCL